MKYLKNREDFLKNVKESYKFNESDISESLLIREAFENDITFGGSLLGRLINSSIRKFKIGYNSTKVSKLLEKLESELDYLVTNALQGDIAKKFNILKLKSFLEEIKDVSLQPNNVSEESKLDELLGDSQGLYDVTDPKKYQRTTGIVQSVIDQVSNDMPDLKAIIGIERDDLLDMLSDFSDELRKLTVDVPTGGTNVVTHNFNTNFGNIIRVVQANQLITAGFNYSLPSEATLLLNYNMFLEMKTMVKGSEIIRVEDGKAEEMKKKGWNYAPKSVWKKGQVDGATQSATQSSNQPTKPVPVQPTSATQSATQSVGPNMKDLIKKVLDILDNTTEEEAKKNDQVKTLVKKLSTEVKTKKEAGSIKVEYGEEQIPLNNAIEKIEMEINEGYYFILENSGGLPGTQSGGTQSNSNNSPNPPSKSTVKDVWERAFSDMDSKNPLRLTQREHDELENLLTQNDNNLLLDVSKRPDPIVGLTRIFGRAHELYFTPVIPSGRPNGRISQKTYREYVKLGGKQAPTPSDSSGPGFGPWAVKSIIRKWTDGVLKILQDQKYRKILSNVKFVVAGAEDKNNESKIYEAEGKTDDNNKSHGQVLFDFINAMLDKNELDDFDGLRSKLLSKYFGIKDAKVKNVSYTQKKVSDEDKQANCFLWQLYNKAQINNQCKNQFFAIPVDTVILGGNKHDVIFVHVLSNIETENGKSWVRVKFTFDSQLIPNKYKEKNFNNNTIDDWSTNNTNYIYYGVMSTNSSDGSMLKIAYANVNTSGGQEINDVYSHSFKIKNGSKSTSNGNKSLYVAKLIRNGQNGNPEPQQGITDEFEVSIKNEDNRHNINWSRKVSGKTKKLLDLLKEEYINI